MFGRVAILLSLFILVESQFQDTPTNSHVVGVNTAHDVRIDKDSVITQNEVLPKKSLDKQTPKPRVRRKRSNLEPEYGYINPLMELEDEYNHDEL